MSQIRGFAGLFDTHGNLIKVLVDTFGLDNTLTPGLPFARFAARGALSKALSFFTEIRSQGAAYHWEIHSVIQDQVITLHFSGSQINDAILIVGAEDGNGLQKLYEEFARNDEEQTQKSKAAYQGQARDLGLFDEFSRLNNELVSMQRELAKKNAELEHLHQEKTRFLGLAVHDLQEAQEKLMRQEKLAVMGQLAGSVGHELRTPLAVITNAVYYLKLVQRDVDENIKDYLNIIQEETGNAEKIISDLLEFSRLTPVNRKVVSIPVLIEGIYQRHPAPESIQVRQEFSREIPNIRVDPQHMEQVFGNLTLNAYQAMENGGILINSAMNAGDFVKISVEDNGMGIPTENLPKLFEPLFTTKSKGTGLGLSICKLLVEANSGWIEVENKPGSGCTFFVFLPAA